MARTPRYRRIHDAFISHAGEDKQDFVKPLADFLRNAGLDIWYDEFSLRVGDSLARSIDQGLARSRFGVVVLSKNFLKKRWPEYELSGLVAKEIASKKTILPVWLDVSRKEVLKYSPSLADKLAIVADKQSIDSIGIKIIEVAKPELFKKIHRQLYEIRSSSLAKKARVDPRTLKVAQIQHSKLSEDLISRIRLIRAALLDPYPLSMRQWIDGFRRDTSPDSEIAIWERTASIYLEHVFAYPSSNKRSSFNQVFGAVAIGVIPKHTKKDILTRECTSGPIEGRETKRYPKRERLPDEDHPDAKNKVAEQTPMETVYRLRLDELRADILTKGSTRIDITEIQQEGVRNLLAEAGAILSEDKNTKDLAIFYGKETLEIFAKRKEETVRFPRPVVIVSYQNDTDDLNYLFVAVQVLKGGCCYGDVPKLRT